VTGSAVTGEGLDDLRAALGLAAAEATARTEADLFRMPVDRVFSIAGAGTVVTGTSWSGSIAVGSEVKLLPGNGSARVRGVEVHGSALDSALPGRRTALALVGLDRKDVGRGHVVVAGRSWRETSSVDVIVTLLPSGRRLTQRSRIRLHLGTAEVMARITPAETEIPPGSTGAARLRLESPVVCRWGDRGVLRSYSPVTTVGGCVVVDPWPAAKPRRPVALERRADPNPQNRLAQFVAIAGASGIAIDELPVRLGIPPDEAARVIASSEGVVRAGDRLLAKQVVSGARDATLRVVAAYHKKNPLEPGMSRELARQAVRDAELGDFVQQALAADGLVALEGKIVRLVEHAPQLEGERLLAGQRLLGELEAAGNLGRTAAELDELASGHGGLELAQYYVRLGTAVRVGRDRYYHKEIVDRLLLQILDEVSRSGEATPGQLRELTGLSRKYLIPLMEWMDSNSYTVRRGDVRTLGPAAKTVLGSVDNG
jgi:selenocysteine-specific elongation factor